MQFNDNFLLAIRPSYPTWPLEGKTRACLYRKGKHFEVSWPGASGMTAASTEREAWELLHQHAPQLFSVTESDMPWLVLQALIARGRLMLSMAPTTFELREQRFHDEIVSMNKVMLDALGATIRQRNVSAMRRGAAKTASFWEVRTSVNCPHVSPRPVRINTLFCPSVDNERGWQIHVRMDTASIGMLQENQRRIEQGFGHLRSMGYEILTVNQGTFLDL